MKTSFLPKNRLGKDNIKKTIIVIGVFIAGYIFFSLANSKILTNITPLWNLRNVVINEGQDIIFFFRTKNSLVEENRLLKDKLAAEESLLYSYRFLEKNHNEFIRDIGRMPDEVKTTAGILVRPPQSMYDILIIDAGGREGVEVGNLIILPFGAVLGTVSKVGRFSSEVTLNSSHGIKTEAMLERDEVAVTLSGQGGGNFEIQIPRGVISKVGDRVLSQGLNPRLIGIVKDVSAESTDSFQRVLVEIPQSIFSIRFIYVLK